MSAEHLGFIAGLITTASFLPQVWRTWHSKSGKDVSAAMLLMLSSGTLLWLIYGIMIGGVPIVIANAVTFTLVMMIFVLKVYYWKKKPR